uniref:1-phosphatidylinositol 4-kinase n=1 Tax=Kwoniella dejecticola CBS 10117 TaxID=1296121 RepID=A0A1A5ZYY4_9TREE|nr:phosphatidylinositol 4-kinase [Kwoniella dejecticola CBS 10117]OBR83005.1 phosphatidylinositol 4-kinase [Kwoniella dejecticola CBS 10117]
MDCLDEPLHLQILTSLASNYARDAKDAEDPNDISVLLNGLPSDSFSGNHADDLIPHDEDDWTEFEINHAISYAHYVSSLPISSSYLPETLTKLNALLFGLIRHGSPAVESDGSPSSSYRSLEAGGLGSTSQAQLCEGLLRALLWVAWAKEDLRDDVAKIFEDFVQKIQELMDSHNSGLTFPLVLLHCMSSVVSHCPLPPFPTSTVASIVKTLIAIASPGKLIKLVHQPSSATSTPHIRPPTTTPFTAPHPITPSGVVMTVTEIMNVLLATSLLPYPNIEQKQKAFAHQAGGCHNQYSSLYGQEKSGSISKIQTNQLVDAGIATDNVQRLSSRADDHAVLDEAIRIALRWWTDLVGGSSFVEEPYSRRGSLFSIGGQQDEEVELMVSVLYLLNNLSLHHSEPDAAHLTRLKLLLSEDSSVSDPRVLEAVFICTSIQVRNDRSLGTAMTHHIRRLLLSPIPAFEGEMGGSGSSVPPAVMAASKCLAICIEMSANDDLTSSTLYSLLNTLSHSATAPGAVSIRSTPVHHHFKGESDSSTVKTSGTGVRATEEQRRLVAVTAVEVVSRLALEIGKEDIIHLSISMLIQRLRGVDLATESTIVTNLVPLALAAPNGDLVEVYRAFSQISRSSHPEDPRNSSNAVLAAQTTLAKGLANRLDCADGYLVELLTLFADKGTQTQMVAMASHGYDSRNKDEVAQLRKEGESRVGDMKAWLAALLIPIATLLSHPSYHPDRGASPEIVAHFRNLWFLCVVFGLSGPAGLKRLSDHETNALRTIAEKTPALVLENSNDFVASDLAYNSILRKDFAAHIQQQQRNALSSYLPHQKHTYDIRNMTTPQTTLLMAISDLEEARTMRYRPSVLLQYFCNDSINESSLIGCLDAISQKISASFLKQVYSQVITHSLPPVVADETCKILVACTHRMRKVREIALSYARQLLETFSALLCDKKVVFTLLEILTLMRRSCELQYTDEYSPVYNFKSDKMDLTLHLTDDYAVRNEITSQLHSVTKHWLTLAISRAPIEVQSTLQTYLNESRDVLLIDSVEMGAGLALHFSKSISRLDRQETIMPNIGGWPSDSSNLVASQFAAKNYFTGELSGARLILTQGLSNLQEGSPANSSPEEMLAFKSQMAQATSNIKTKNKPFTVPEIRRILLRAVSVLVASPRMDRDILHYLVELPMAAFTPLAIAAGVDAWTWLLRQRPEAEVAIIGAITAGWLHTIRQRKGLFSTSMNYRDPFEQPVEYAPSDKKVLDLELAKARKLLRPHLLLIQVLSSQFQAIKYRERGIMVSLIRLMMRSLKAHKHMSTHPLAREVRFSLLLFGFQMLASSRMEALLELRFRDQLFSAAFSWFAFRPQWSFGSDRIQVGAEIKLLQDLLQVVQEDKIRGSASMHEYENQHRDRVKLLQLLVENEVSRMSVWCNPLNETGRPNLPATGALERATGGDEWTRLVGKAWKLNPAMAVHMGERFKNAPVQAEISRLVKSDPKSVIQVAEALHFLLGDKLENNARAALKWLPVWAAVPPVTAIVYFQPRYGNHPLILQYAMRVLEQHPVELTFFFVPQVVQALRADALGYVERFVFETSKISQLFCHQIIWNMKANTYRDDDASQPDPMKPLLDRMIDMIVAGLSGKAKAFYDLEFTFFDAVTSISGKLKPFIKKSKPEKKAKIDEEMALIDLSVGVYLPSNPDGVVIDLDRKSGRPLQSHAKAPFMATFRVQKERIDLPSDSNIEIADEAKMIKTKYDVWQSAIFKVGDDCRQDVLALQIIAMFKNVFTSIGLTLYLFPYRVTATAPGCGVIDVVPNATSRDEMGRAKINDLFSYFVDKYGGVDTVSFQKARLNFIQSMAAYSVACYILQIKDRHNGNIMIDGDGHIVHIDFGFLFDIGPGGIKFEPSSFKLNHEMVALMGGRESQGYKMFTELTVKAFLAIRPHADQLVDCVHLMLGTALPSFKGEGTIMRLRNRFQLQLSERQAADYMMGVVENARENVRSNVYDGFQKIQK